MFEIYINSSSNANTYTISQQEFKDMLLILDLNCIDKDCDNLCKDLQFQSGCDINFNQFNATIARFTDTTFIGQEIVRAQAHLKKKKGAENSMLTSLKLMLKFERAIMENRITQLRLVFDHCDSDKSGEIDFDEFASIMETLQQANNALQLTESELQQAFVAIDENGSGTISFPEFVHYHVYERTQANRLHKKLIDAAHKIYKQFIGDSAAKQVNIKGPTALQITQDINNNNIHVHMFDKAEEEILKLMSADSFARFKQSELFGQFLESADSYKHVEGNKDDRAYEKAKQNFQKIKEKEAKETKDKENNDNSNLDNTGRSASKTVTSTSPTLQTPAFNGLGFQPKVRKGSYDPSAANAIKPNASLDQLIDQIDNRRNRRRSSQDLTGNISDLNQINVQLPSDESKESVIGLSATVPEKRDKPIVTAVTAKPIAPIGNSTNVTQTPEEIRAHQEQYKAQQRAMLRGA
jgi:hypothetical protein